MSNVDWRRSETLKVIVALALAWTAAITVALVRLPLDGPTRLVIEEREKVFVPGLGTPRTGTGFAYALAVHAHEQGFALDVEGFVGPMWRTEYSAEGKRLSGPSKLAPHAMQTARAHPDCTHIVAARLTVGDRGSLSAYPFGRHCIVAAPNERLEDQASTGAVYVVDPTAQRIVSRIERPGTEAVVRFGHTVAADDDGGLLLVSAQRAVDRTGKVYLFDVKDMERPVAGPDLHPYDPPDNQQSIGRSLALLTIDGRHRPDANLHAQGLSFAFVGDPTDQEGHLQAGGAVTMYRITRANRGSITPLSWASMILIFGTFIGIGGWSATRKRR